MLCVSHQNKACFARVRKAVLRVNEDTSSVIKVNTEYTHLYLTVQALDAVYTCKDQ